MAGPSTAAATGPSLVVGLLHLFGFSSFAFAQPLLERLTERTPYLVDQEFTQGSLVALCLAVALVVPAALGLAEIAVRLISHSFHRWIHLVFVFGLSWLTVSGAVRVVFNEPSVKELGIPWFVGVIAATLVAAIVTRLYARAALARRFMTVLSIGSIVFPLRFLFASPVTSLVFPSPETSTIAVHAGNPIPVVMIVFDEFDGLALLDERGEIHAELFPNFARLADEGLWFGNATTNHCRTERAVPAMLTGAIVHKLGSSTETFFPNNLFALLRRTGQYETRAYEPFTRLCTPSQLLRQAPSIPNVVKFCDAAWTLVAVYRTAVLPPDLPVPEIRIPRDWFGISGDFKSDSQSSDNVQRYSWDANRGDQFAEFLGDLQPTSRPRFNFIHVGLPHYPWVHLPSGRSYAPELRYGMFPAAITGEGEEWIEDPLAVQLSWDRYILQVRYIDRLIGQLIDAMKERGLWDRSLLIVTSDHGAAFTPGLSRRAPQGENLAEIACVPLFFKFPGMQPDRGSLTRRSAETIDVLPTIAEVLELNLPSPVDGSSLLDPDRSERPRKSLYVDDRLIPMPLGFPEQRSTLARLQHDYGTHRIDVRTELGGSRPWIGESVTSFKIADDVPRRIGLKHGGPATKSTPDVVPCFVHGYVVGFRDAKNPLHLAIAVNGRIEAVTRTYRDAKVPEWFAAMLPEEAFSGNSSNLEIFEVRPNDSETLRRCEMFGDPFED